MYLNIFFIFSFLVSQNLLVGCDGAKTENSDSELSGELKTLEAPSDSPKSTGVETLHVPRGVEAPPSSLGDYSLLMVESQVKSGLIKLPQEISWHGPTCLPLEDEDPGLGPNYWIGHKGNSAKSRFVVIFGSSLSSFNPKAELKAGGTWVNFIVNKLADENQDITFIVAEGMWTKATLNKRKGDAKKTQEETPNYQIESVARDHYLRLKAYLQSRKDDINTEGVQIIGLSAGANLALMVQQNDDASAENIFNAGTVAFSPVLDLNATISKVKHGFEEATHRLEKDSRISRGFTNVKALFDVGAKVFHWAQNGGQPPIGEAEALDRIYEDFVEDLQSIWESVMEEPLLIHENSVNQQIIDKFGLLKLQDCVNNITTKTTIVVGMSDPICVLSNKNEENLLFNSIDKTEAIRVVRFNSPFGHLSYLSKEGEASLSEIFHSSCSER